MARKNNFEVASDDDVDEDEVEEDDDEDLEDDDVDFNANSGGKDPTRKRSRSQFIDDVAEEDDEEDEDEDDDGPRRGKKGKSKRSMFIDDAAAVASDEEEEEEAEEEGFIQDEDLGDLPGETERAPRRRPMSWQQEENDEDIERFIQERYGQRSQENQYEDAEATEVEQQALLPSIKDPKLWMVKCQSGHEREAAVTLMQKYLNQAAKGENLLIKSAVALDHLKGFVYVESDKEAYVKQACAGLRLVSSYKVTLVPIKEMTEVLTVEKKPVELELNTWVRIKIGLYKGDLGQVVDVDTIKQTATVKLIPRVDWDLVAAKQDKTADSKKKKTRPVPRFFSVDEAKNHKVVVISRRDPLTGDPYYTVDSLSFKDGYLWKTVSLKSLDSNNVVPTLDELQRFQRPTEGEEDGRQLAPALAAKQRAKLQKGDVVQVVEGDMKGLKAKIEKVDGDEVVVRGLMEDFKDTLLLKERQLRKHFSVGDHVKVIAGQHEGATGLIVKIQEQIVVILTDKAREEIKVFSRDIVSSSEVASGPVQLGEYELHDIVQLDQSNFGVIIKVEQSGFEVLLGMPERATTQVVKLRDIRRKIFDRKSRSQDSAGNLVSVKDVVRVMDGPHKGKSGTVEHLHRSVLFLHDRNLVEHGGFFVAKSASCRALGATKTGEQRPMAVQGDRNSYTGMVASAGYGGYQSPHRGGGGGAMQEYGGGGGGGRFGRGGFGRGGGGRGGGGRHRDDAMVGRTVKIRGGPFKGYKGRIMDATDTTVRVELESQMKVVTVRRDQLPEGEQRMASPYVRESPRYGAGSETPMHSRTPMHTGFGSLRADPSATPIHEGMRTPMRDRAWNPQLPPTTPLRNDTWDDANPSTWKPPGSYGSEEYQPASPALSPPDSNAPTPLDPSTPGLLGRSYDAPTPAVAATNGGAWSHGSSAPTPQTVQEAGTPYGGNAPSPYLNPSTPGGAYPSTPGGAYLPSTPGAQPATPGGLSLNAATPAFWGGDSQLVTDIIVTFSSGVDEGELGVIQEILPDGSYRIALGPKGDGRLVTAVHAEVELVQPKKNERIKVISGEYRGLTGKLIQLDANDAIVKMDKSELSVKAYEVTDIGKLAL